MEQHRIKRVPVIRDNRIVGIVSRANLLRGLARLADEAPAATANDLAIREQILTELDAQARFELRLADGAANPYLLQAAVLAAGLDGIKNKRDPGSGIGGRGGVRGDGADGKSGRRTGDRPTAFE